MTKLFHVESQSAGEGLMPPGAWVKIAEADTLEEAKELAQADEKKGWRYARVVADIELTEALRAIAREFVDHENTHFMPPEKRVEYARRFEDLIGETP